MPDDEGVGCFEDRPLPGIERWAMDVPPAAEWLTSRAEWVGALVLVEQGVIELDCLAGGRCRYVAGDLIAPSWLPLTRMRNPGAEPARLVAVRREIPARPRQRVGSRIPR